MSVWQKLKHRSRVVLIGAMNPPLRPYIKPTREDFVPEGFYINSLLVCELLLLARGNLFLITKTKKNIYTDIYFIYLLYIKITKK